MFIRLTLLIVFIFSQITNAFIPAEIIEKIFGRLDKLGFKETDYYTDTTTHDEIIHKGMIQSVTQYYYNQPNGSLKINLTKDYYSMRDVYYDYYGIWLCDLQIDSLITDIFKVNVAIVDLDSSTTKFPYAHFDSEKFIESNNRIINFTSMIYSYLNVKDYTNAGVLSGQILHTIQDFYSHSNWVEMGKTDINYDIGNSNFSNLAIAAPTDANTCASNCTFSTIQCGIFLTSVTNFINLVGLQSILNSFSCPLKYYKCDNNIALLDRLVSGYSVNQKLQDGTPVNKPSNIGKCSHGGFMDTSAFLPAEGGINKDSGYYMLSPHANLHQKAANLAIKHTKYFFETIRSKIGNQEYANFLKLVPTTEVLSKGKTTYYSCDSNNLVVFNLTYILVLLHCLYFFFQ